MFITYTPLDPSQSSVATIGEHTASAAGIGTVRVSWYDDDHTLHTYDLPHMLHFPKSSVNLISVTAFGKVFDLQFLHDKGSEVSISTTQSQSVLKWNQSRRAIVHPPSGLPELPLADADAKKVYYSRVSECAHICACKNEDAYSYLTVSDSSADTSPAAIVNDRTGLTAAKTC